MFTDSQKDIHIEFSEGSGYYDEAVTLEIRGGGENRIYYTLAGKDQKLRDTQVLYHQEKSKLDALSNLTERYEGYGGAVKAVMEQKAKKKGIIGVVADIIQAEAKYETCVSRSFWSFPASSSRIPASFSSDTSCLSRSS